MTFFVSGLIFLALAVLTFHPAMRLFQAKNPPFFGMVLTLGSSFLGVYAALMLSRVEERRDRMDRAATLMEMTRENLSTSRGEARNLAHFTRADSFRSGEWEKRMPGSLHPNRPSGLAELLNNGAVLEQISPESLKALLASQSRMERDLLALGASQGRQRRRRLESYLREVVFAQGVLAAEAEFQRGNIGRRDVVEILLEWESKQVPQPI
jgi:hypothetical protein